MATIYKRGRYWWIAYRDQYGKKKQKSLKVGQKPDALKLKRHYEAIERLPHLKGTNLQKSVKLDDWTEEFNRRRINRVARTTNLRENQAIRSFRETTDKKCMDQITADDIEVWYDLQLKRVRTATANCLLRHIKVYFNHAVTENYLPASPAKNVRPVKEATKPVRVFLKEEFRSIVNVMPDYWKNLVKVAIYTGARAGEITRIKVRDIDVENRNPNVTIRSTQSNPTKSKKSRVVPLPKNSLDFFSEMIKGKNLEEHLLKNAHGKAWSSLWVSKGFARHVKKAGIKDCSFHDLRRTYGAWLVMEGADLVTVQENLGHSDIKVTIKHYMSLVLKHRARQTDKFPDLD